MNKVIQFGNKPVLVAAVTLLFLLGVIRRFAGR